MSYDDISFYKTVLIFALSLSLVAAHIDKRKLKFPITRLLFGIVKNCVYVFAGFGVFGVLIFFAGFMSVFVRMAWARGVASFYTG